MSLLPPLTYLPTMQRCHCEFCIFDQTQNISDWVSFKGVAPPVKSTVSPFVVAEAVAAAAVPVKFDGEGFDAAAMAVPKL